MRFSFILNASIGPFVILLNRRCSPSAVTRFVIAVVVNTVKRGVFRSLPHISDEVFKRLSPSLADSNSASAIVGVSSGATAQAAANHSVPDSVDNTFGHPVGCASFTLGLDKKTSATANVPACERVAGHDFLPAAFAFALPKNQEVLVAANEPHNLEAAEFSASKVRRSCAEFRKRERFGSIYGSHENSFRKKDDCGQGRRGVYSTMFRPALFYHKGL